MSQAPPTAPAQKKTSSAARAVGAIAAFLALVAIALIALGAIGLANVATPNMRGFNPGATVTTTDRGMSVYARSDSDRASTVCTADDGSATTLARPTGEFSVDVSGSDFYEVARTPDDLAAGSYALTCQGTEQALYVGPAAPNTSASGLMGPASLVGGIVLGFFALVLMIIAIVMGRGRRGQQADTGAAYPYQSYPPAGYPPPPGGQQSGAGESAAGASAQRPYGAPPPPPYGQGSQSGQTTAFPQQENPQQSYAPPPPPGWGATSSEPTQAIPYGQGQYGQPDTEHGSDGGEGSGEAPSSEGQGDAAHEGDVTPAGQDRASDSSSGAEHDNDGEHPHTDDDPTDGSHRYPPPPPPP